MRSLLILCCVAFASPALATSADDDFEKIGEVNVDFKNVAYAKVSVDGEDWPAHEFEKAGKRLAILGLELNKQATFDIVLTPFDSGFGPVAVTVEAKKFKKRRRGRLLLYVLKLKPIKFPVLKKDEGKKPAEPTEPTEPTGPPDEDTDL
jgi:hypothetical protein